MRDSTASNYYDFADDIKFDDARLMASTGDGNGLCHWFNGLGHNFGSWLHKAQYFAKTFWNKTPDEIIGVGRDTDFLFFKLNKTKGVKNNMFTQCYQNYIILVTL